MVPDHRTQPSPSRRGDVYEISCGSPTDSYLPGLADSETYKGLQIVRHGGHDLLRMRNEDTVLLPTVVQLIINTEKSHSSRRSPL